MRQLRARRGTATVRHDVGRRGSRDRYRRDGQSRRTAQYTPPFQLARSLCLFGAAAAGVPAIDAVYTDFRDAEGLRAEARGRCRSRLRRQGRDPSRHRFNASTKSSRPSDERIARSDCDRGRLRAAAGRRRCQHRRPHVRPPALDAPRSACSRADAAQRIAQAAERANMNQLDATFRRQPCPQHQPQRRRADDRHYPLVGDHGHRSLARLQRALRHLSDGAWPAPTVIKVEPFQGEHLRSRGDMGGAALPFAMLNSNKKPVTLNLKTEKGRDLLREMVARADILVENFAPGVMDRLGVGRRGSAQDQPAADLRLELGLRQGRSLSRLSGDGSRDAGDVRRHQFDGLSGPAAGQVGRGHVRFQGRHPSLCARS